MRIFDAVCNFLTRQTARITTRLPTIGAMIINEQVIITMIRMAVSAAVLGGDGPTSVVVLFVRLVLLVRTLNVVRVEVEVEGCRRRTVLNGFVDPLTSV